MAILKVHRIKIWFFGPPAAILFAMGWTIFGVGSFLRWCGGEIGCASAWFFSLAAESLTEEEYEEFKAENEEMES